jgi:CubicO group peptidase (beta-lactamase class C family)
MDAIRKPVAVVAFLLGLMSLSGAAQQQTPLLSTTPTLPLLGSYLEALRQQAGIPGMSGVLVRDRAIAWSQGFGFADVNARISAAPDTPYLVGDVSEIFAATLLMQCVEQRHLDLDAPISKLGLSDPEPDTTLRLLLSHAAPDGAPTPFVFSPDRYSHLTEVMEACAPQPYRKSVAHRLLDSKSNMNDSVPGTDFADPDLQLPDGLFDPSDVDRYRHTLQRLAVPYRVDAKKRATRNTDLALMPVTASNGLVSTAIDLGKFDAALTPVDVDDASAFLLQDTLNAMWTPAFGRNGAQLPTGLGWFVQFYNGEKIVWSFGNVPGAYSALVLKMPNRGVTFILLANSDGLSAPFNLAQGDVTKSVFASVFLKLFLS